MGEPGGRKLSDQTHQLALVLLQTDESKLLANRVDASFPVTRTNLSYSFK